MANPESFLFLPQGDESAKSINPTPRSVGSIWGEQEWSLDSASSASELDTCSEVTADDEYIAGLAQQMAEFTIQEDHNNKQAIPKTWGLATSPQSTLWSPFGSKERLVGGVPETEYPKLQVAKKKKIRQQKRVEIQDSERSNPPPQLQPLPYPGAGVRASGSGHRSGSSGTGVFLPRGDLSNNNPSRPRKKLGCSRVVIPARVAHALKLHFDHVSKPKSSTPSDTSKDETDGSAANPQLEVALPQEWTY